MCIASIHGRKPPGCERKVIIMINSVEITKEADETELFVDFYTDASNSNYL